MTVHEMSLAESILQIVEEAATQGGFQRVSEIHLEIGALAGVEREALDFCLTSVLKDSLAEGARVITTERPGTGWCMACGEGVPLQALHDACPRCGGHQVQPTGGMEMRVKEILAE